MAKPRTATKPAKKKPKAPKAKGGKVSPSEVRPAITQSKLKSLMSAARSTTKDVASVNGAMREKIAYAKEHDHLHTGAFSLIRRLDRMEPEKLADFMDSFEHYMDIGGLDDRRNQVQRMGFGTGGEGEGEPTDNVREFRAPSSVAAE